MNNRALLLSVFRALAPAAAARARVMIVGATALPVETAPADHPARTAGLTARFGAREDGWLGRIEDPDGAWRAFVDSSGLVLIYPARDDGRLVGNPLLLHRADLLCSGVRPPARDNGSGAVHVDKPLGFLKHRDLEIHIDRHEGDVIEGIGPDGEPYHFVQQHPYGFLKGILGDDGDDWDMWVGPDHTSERVHIVTQCKAGTGRYDEQKGMVGWAKPEDAAGVYKAHTHTTMYGRIGSLSYDAFYQQLDAYRKLPDGERGPFRAETEEDGAELKQVREIGEDWDLPVPSSKRPGVEA